MAEDIGVKLNAEVTVPGKHPIVLIGPNGSGKTRFGAELASSNNAEFVGALRNIALPETIPMQGLDEAKNELTRNLSRHRSRYWQITNEITNLFAKLLAEDATSAIRFRDGHAARKATELEQTNLMRLKAAWTDFFPRRSIDFSTYKPTVSSDFGSETSSYSASRMSDGERVALYLGARILNTQSNVVVVDEPEVHFHSRLAVRFWNALERFRPDIRFVYITHDLTFALSRESAQFVVIKPNAEPVILPLDAGLPTTLAESILGAASFSIYARRIVFCEGQEGEAGDYSFYSRWFEGYDTAVIPVGSCKDVVQCTQAFNNQQLVAGVCAVGVVDRDYWPDRYLELLLSSIHVLPVHEVENLFCLPQVFEAVGRHLSLEPAEVTKRYETFISQTKATFKGGLLAKQISERFKRRCDGALESVINGLSVTDDLDELENKHVAALQPGKWGFAPQDILREERDRLEKALASDANALLQLFPGKVFFPIAAKILGIDRVRYRELVGAALVADKEDNLSALGKQLETALLKLLPPRNIDGAGPEELEDEDKRLGSDMTPE